MRNFVRKVSRTAGFLGLFTGSIIFANAQSNEGAWTTSKEVQKIANRRIFNDANLRSSHLQVNSLGPTWMIAKGVHRRTKETAVAKDNVKSIGIPSWTISKGVQRIGRVKLQDYKVK